MEEFKLCEFRLTFNIQAPIQAKFTGAVMEHPKDETNQGLCLHFMHFEYRSGWCRDQGRMPQDGSLWHEDYSELKATETLQDQDKLLPLP